MKRKSPYMLVDNALFSIKFEMVPAKRAGILPYGSASCGEKRGSRYAMEALVLLLTFCECPGL